MNEEEENSDDGLERNEEWYEAGLVLGFALVRVMRLWIFFSPC